MRRPKTVAGLFVLAAAFVMGAPSKAQQPFPPSPAGVKTLSPEGEYPTGTWHLATRAGDFVFIAGMRGIDARPTPSCKVTRPGSCRCSST